MAKNTKTQTAKKGAGKNTGGTTQRRTVGMGRGKNQGMSEPTDDFSDGEDDEEETGTPDRDYNLISILYHALQGAETYAEYCEDAEEDGDRELMEFFTECQEAERERADRAKQLLAARLARTSGRATRGRGRGLQESAHEM
jgi:hypothetical protein